MGLPFIGELIDDVKDLVSEAVVDKDKKLQIEYQLAELEDRAQARADELIKAQIEVNQVEASHGSIFVAGWRPAVGWVGAGGLAYSAILEPLMSWTAKVVFSYTGTFPVINTELLLYLLGGMLGLGGMRSWEKAKGVSTNDYRDTPARVTPIATPAVEAPKPEVKKKKRKFKLF